MFCGGEDPIDTDAGYLDDPSLFRDDLPQPYRRINKILWENVFDVAWERISKWESNRIKEASRIRPPAYDCASPLQLGIFSVRCLSVSSNGFYVFVGLSNGLAILSASSQQVEAIWLDDGLEITEADLVSLSEGITLINCKDKQGVVRLFTYTKQMLFPLHAFVELDESAPRNIVKSSISSAADFIGLCILDKSNSQQPQHCLEIYKLPRDAWLIEIEAVAAKYIDERLSASRLDLADESRGNVASAGTSGTSNTVDATTGEPVKGNTDIHVHPRLHSASIQRQLSGQKFSVPVSNLKLQHLNTPSRMTWSSPYQASKVVGSDGDVIGVGINHLISSAHMTNRFAAFRSQHQQYLNYLLKDSQPSLSNPLPSFHFLPSGKISSRDTHPAGQTNMLAIWWSGDPYLMYYSLNKQTKGVNRPEIAWPVSCPVVCSAVTECGCSVALALANNSVIIWDRVLGLPCKAIRVNDPGQISWIRFVSSPSSEKCNGTKSGVTLLVLSTTGSIYTVTCTSDNDPIATLVSTEVLSEFEIPSAIEPIGGIPELILIVRRDGKIFLHDIYRKESLCEVALPPSSNTASDSEGFSVVALAASSGKMLYVKRTIAKTEDGNEDLSGDIHDDASLYVVKTWLFPHLDDYLKENSQSLQHHLPCPRRSSNRLEEHISNTMQKRIEDQQSRKSRLNARWFQMKEELSLKLHAESRAAK